jgi:hypothetical protein
MASNLSSIGFVFDDAEHFQRAMIKCAAEASERVGCAVGDYSIWRSRTGAEIWFHLPLLGTEDSSQDIAGLTPFYEGLSDVDLEVVERINRFDDNAFEGALTAQVKDPDGSNDGFPLTFDAVDFTVHSDRQLPFRARARIVGFARHVRAFQDEAAYAADKSGPLGEIALAPKAFIPVGHFSEAEDGASEQPAQSTALITGTVSEHRVQINEATGRSFHWILVDSLSTSFDIVADPEIVSGEIAVGGTVEVGAVMIGRLVESL